MHLWRLEKESPENGRKSTPFASRCAQTLFACFPTTRSIHAAFVDGRQRFSYVIGKSGSGRISNTCLRINIRHQRAGKTIPINNKYFISFPIETGDTKKKQPQPLDRAPANKTRLEKFPKSWIVDKL